ncbi:hypothetical protein GTQ34_01245 [Muricauda sp. JGD-17]|uniref:Lipocalin-like domain-containing protein n=1 Tax=Flagellimonas ochracea TaxID=2696472 RepID=A0A964T964_9FLAO|nr:hypothetical protein [Allomuricauda ochracea]NAY90529.1 hypothetical protein [Allomuricauda ochracea]
MKKIIGLAILMLLFISATTLTSPKPVSMHSIEGTWELQSFYSYDDGVNVSDTVPKSDGYRQVKMYYNGKVMWSRYVPNDNNGRFGYGSYYITDDELHETIIYGDAEMMKALDTLTEFVFELDLKDDAYSQITLDEDGNRTFSENYKRID